MQQFAVADRVPVATHESEFFEQFRAVVEPAVGDDHHTAGRVLPGLVLAEGLGRGGEQHMAKGRIVPTP